MKSKLHVSKASDDAVPKGCIFYQSNCPPALAKNLK